MSWDVFIMRIPADCADIVDLPAGWVPEDIGTVAEARAAIEAVIPGFAWYSDGSGDGKGNGFTVETSGLANPAETTKDIGLMFRGGGDAPLAAMAIAHLLGARAISGNEFLEPGNAAEQLETWHRYLAQVQASGDDRPATT